MRLHLETDEFDRLIATLTDGTKTALVTGRDSASAAADLGGALDALVESGIGESFWLESHGEYRWLLRRNGERVRVVVLWSNGVVTGWQQVFDVECDFARFVDECRRELLGAPFCSPS